MRNEERDDEKKSDMPISVKLNCACFAVYMFA